MLKDVFENPKPLEVIREFVESSSENDDIVLDFFSGSATTAHAVMQLNAEDGGKRQFIMVQLPEDIDESMNTADSRAKKTLTNKEICNTIKLVLYVHKVTLGER